ncbi:MAG: hypothetical protein OFPI_39580 [Osedax symbiont Rs2]|nr:MAG: hypothetical protein OFPI_39580 [Osedax symbiont Rs2]
MAPGLNLVVYPLSDLLPRWQKLSVFNTVAQSVCGFFAGCQGSA